MGNRCLLVIFVSGNSLLPEPPASTTPFISSHSGTKGLAEHSGAPQAIKRGRSGGCTGGEHEPRTKHLSGLVARWALDRFCEDRSGWQARICLPDLSFGRHTRESGRSR